MGDYIQTKEVKVLIQANGIIRNTKGRFLARLDDEIDFHGEHIIEEHPVEEKMYSREEVIQVIKGFDGARFVAKHMEKGFDTDKWIEENL